jgi:hypothetical protein
MLGPKPKGVIATDPLWRTSRGHDPPSMGFGECETGRAVSGRGASGGMRSWCDDDVAGHAVPVVIGAPEREGGGLARDEKQISHFSRRDIDL